MTDTPPYTTDCWRMGKNIIIKPLIPIRDEATNDLQPRKFLTKIIFVSSRSSCILVIASASLGFWYLER
jgi:hypothetical protein